MKLRELIELFFFKFNLIPNSTRLAIPIWLHLLPLKAHWVPLVWGENENIYKGEDQRVKTTNRVKVGDFFVYIYPLHPFHNSSRNCFGVFSLCIAETLTLGFPRDLRFSFSVVLFFSPDLCEIWASTLIILVFVADYWTFILLLG